MFTKHRHAHVLTLLLILVAMMAGGVASWAAEAPPISFALPEKPSGGAEADYFSRYLLQTAYTMIEADNYYQARNLIERALKERPDDAVLLRINAHLLIRLKYWPEIDRVLTGILAVEPDAPDALAWRGYARFMMRDGGGAERDFIRLRDLGAPAGLVAYAGKLLPEVREFNKQFEGATVEQWAELRKREAELEKSDDVAGLEAFYGELVENPATAAYGHMSRGLLRFRLDRFDEAERDFAAASDMAGMDGGRSGEMRATIENLRREREKLARWESVREDAARLEKAGDVDGLLALYGELVGEDDFRTYALSSRGFVLYGAGRLDEALRDFGEALKDGSLDGETRQEIAAAAAAIRENVGAAKEWDAMRKRIAALEAAGDDDALETLYSNLVGHERYRQFAYSSRGFLRLKRGRTEEALRDLEEALQLNGDDDEAKKEIREAVAQIRRDARLAKEWDDVVARIETLKRSGDVDALERLYTDLAGRDRYRRYALSSRGFLRLEQNRLDEAERDFRAAMKLPGMDGGSRRDILLALSRVVVEREAARYKAAGDTAGLEAYYTGLLERPEHRERALVARGYLRLGDGRPDEAEEDFRRALDLPEVSERTRLDIGKALADLRSERRREREWRDAVAQAAVLEKDDNLAALDDLLSVIVDDQPANSYARGMRGMNRVSLGRAEEARADLLAALADAGLDADYRKRIEEVVADVDAALAAGRVPNNLRAAALLGETGVMLAEGKREKAVELLTAVAKYTISDAQRGAYLHYAAELYWLAERYDEARPLYCEAVPLLKDRELLSESLWKLAEYEHKERKNRDLAIEYAGRSIAASPDSPWRNAQVGYLYRSYGMNGEAVAHFKKALATGKIKPDEVGFHRELATAYLMLGDKDSFHRHMELHIDSEEARMAKAGGGDAAKIRAVHKDREFNANAGKRVRGYAYLFSSRFDNGDYLIQSLNEVYCRITPFDWINVEAYFQTVGALASSFSGTYYDASSSGYERYSGKQGLDDTLKVAAGLKANFAHGFSLSLDRVFKIGRETDNDVRFRVGYFGGIGTTWDPTRQSWNYVTGYADAVYSLEHDDFTAFSEIKAGRSFRLDRFAEKLVATPFVGATVSCNGRSAPSAEKWAVEAGPGVSLKKWLREDEYHASRSGWEAIVQYRLGLTNNRENALSATLSYSF